MKQKKIKEMKNVKVLGKTPDVEEIREQLAGKFSDVIDFLKENKIPVFALDDLDKKEINNFHIKFEDELKILSAYKYSIHSLEEIVDTTYRILNKIAENEKALKNKKGKLTKIINYYEIIISNIEYLSYVWASFFWNEEEKKKKSLFYIFLNSVNWCEAAVCEHLRTLENKIRDYIVNISKCGTTNFSALEIEKMKHKLVENENNISILQEVLCFLSGFLNCILNEIKILENM